ncbi:threonine ammonia-lyase [Nocardioides sp. TRM66260-LWL]|uniref:threonine ammonia-lyase n=1 Tax=Nocardioides sp. TRM66260-LWL TaxID=2874478 RepID=UPI001CC67561|nr:threonine ammonia-lyase [Nocardioides sp. TRM66260-LWL]MBZ5736147.1 threonine ammonia-lyase [Nocardioides sp. TRM66260-LWL]
MSVPPLEPGTLTADDFSRAREELSDVVLRTPVTESRLLTEVAGVPAVLKCENLQRTGSFKIRGAYLRISRLSPEERARGVVAASAGNHAQGVALAAQLLGIPATVFMPEGAPLPKERATRGYGADVVFAGTYLEQALAAARAHAEATGAVLIHPFDHLDVIAGQGTVALELLEQVPDAATVVVPTGGGGLLAGIALALKAHRPDVSVVGVQAKNAAAYPGSLERGRPTPLEQMRTMADGIAVGLPGDLTFPAVRDHVDDVLTVTEDSLARAVLALAEREKLVAEPAGAAAVAAILDRPGAFAGPVVAVVSGGNIDPLLLGKVIRHGMAAAGRYLHLAVTIPDVPGGLAGLLTEVGGSGANVLEVVHERVSPRLGVDEVEVALSLETRGAEHSEQVVARLRDAGFLVAAAS